MGEPDSNINNYGCLIYFVRISIWVPCVEEALLMRIVAHPLSWVGFASLFEFTSKRPSFISWLNVKNKCLYMCKKGHSLVYIVCSKTNPDNRIHLSGNKTTKNIEKINQI